MHLLNKTFQIKKIISFHNLHLSKQALIIISLYIKKFVQLAYTKLGIKFLYILYKGKHVYEYYKCKKNKKLHVHISHLGIMC